MISGGLLGLAAHGFAPLSDGIAHGPVPWVVLATAGFLLAGKQIPVGRPAGPRGRRHRTAPRCAEKHQALSSRSGVSCRTARRNGSPRRSSAAQPAIACSCVA